MDELDPASARNDAPNPAADDPAVGVNQALRALVEMHEALSKQHVHTAEAIELTRQHLASALRLASDAAR